MAVVSNDDDNDITVVIIIIISYLEIVFSSVVEGLIII